jgi:hypothetical protein
LIEDKKEKMKSARLQVIPCAGEILVLVAAGLRARHACAGRDARITEKHEISTAHSIKSPSPLFAGNQSRRV